MPLLGNTVSDAITLGDTLGDDTRLRDSDGDDDDDGDGDGDSEGDKTPLVQPEEVVLQLCCTERGGKK
jgi:hypothetical protein